ncbi:MAG: hypothetical protein ACYDDC_09225, partial [Thermoplasmataceae archaeon]
MNNLILVLFTELIMTPVIILTLLYIMQFQKKISSKGLGFLYIFLSMMSGMLNSLTYYIVLPNGFLNNITVINISMFEMTAALAYILWSTFNKRFHTMHESHKFWIAIILAWNEISMAVFLQVLAFGGNFSSIASVLDILGNSIISPLFVIPMISEMAVIAIFIKKSRILRNTIIVLILMQASDPMILLTHVYFTLFSIIFAGVMISVMVYYFEYLAKRKMNLKSSEVFMITIIFSILLLSSAGLLISFIIKTPTGLAWLFFAFSMVVSMVVYFMIGTGYLNEKLDKKLKSDTTKGWVNRQYFMFFILLSSFISEIFMAASFITLKMPYNASGTTLLTDMSNSLGGTNTFAGMALPVDIVYFITAIGNSVYFLTMMGIEMGALVIFQIKKIWRVDRGKVINLIMALTAFWLYTTIGPNFFLGRVTFLPLWANTGALGPLYPYFVIPLIGSYVLY